MDSRCIYCTCIINMFVYNYSTNLEGTLLSHTEVVIVVTEGAVNGLTCVEELVVCVSMATVLVKTSLVLLTVGVSVTYGN